MKKTTLTLVTGILAGVISTSALADTSSFSYEHMYLMHNRYHKDQMRMNYQFTDGLYFGIGVNLFNKKRDVFDDLSFTSNYFDIQYRYKYNDKLTVRPLLRLKFYGGTDSSNEGWNTSDEVSDNGERGARYTPGVRVKYNVFSQMALMAQYEFEMRRFAKRDGGSRSPSRHRQVMKIGLDYRYSKALKVNYEYTYYEGNYVLADNNKTDYKQELEVFYRINHNWQPYIGLADLAASTTNDTREMRLTTGVNYYF